jgi:hypothetical protein
LDRQEVAALCERARNVASALAPFPSLPFFSSLRAASPSKPFATNHAGKLNAILFEKGQVNLTPPQILARQLAVAVSTTADANFLVCLHQKFRAKPRLLLLLLLLKLYGCLPRLLLQSISFSRSSDTCNTARSLRRTFVKTHLAFRLIFLSFWLDLFELLA